MKVITALVLAISALATAAPNVNGALLSARQEECQYKCSCLVESGAPERDDAETTHCCYAVGGNIENQPGGRVCTPLGFASAEEFAECCFGSPDYACSSDDAGCPTVDVL